MLERLAGIVVAARSGNVDLRCEMGRKTYV